MKINIMGLALIASLAACSGGNPFDDDTGTGTGGTGTGGTGTGGTSGDGTNGDGTTTGDGTNGDTDTDTSGIYGDVPPGTAEPTNSSSIVRYEERDGDDGTNGFVREVRHVPLSADGQSGDTFIVDNLAFDSANVYKRGDPSNGGVGTLSGFAVYESTTPFPDSVTGDPIDQFGYRAIYGVSKNKNAAGQPTTKFAIVRSASFKNYGFGGFLYQRDGSVTLPETGQATFTGKTAGIRDFDGQGGLQFTTGKIKIDIDFEDFNDITGERGDGVKLEWTNRKVYDASGNDITASISSAIFVGTPMESLPVAQLTVRPNNLKDSGDLVGDIESSTVDGDDYETGEFYAVVSGDDPDEIAGVIVVTNNGDYENVTTRETAGFIAYRGANN